MPLTEPRHTYRPFEYEWMYTAFKEQNAMHWTADEVSFHRDIGDWNKRLTDAERHLLTQVFRFFTQGDIAVASGYVHNYMPIFAHKPEATMMLCSFANMEGVHIDAYSKLIDTLGLPEVEYSAFMKYKSMSDKYEYIQQFDNTSVRSIAKSLAVYSAFTEGLQLFSSFVILLSFPKRGLLNAMGTIVNWSVRDEGTHVECMLRLFREYIAEHPRIWTDEFKKELYDICRTMVDLEESFLDTVFEMGPVEGLDKASVMEYIKYIADRRLLQLGLKPNYGVKDNPLPWVEDMLNSTSRTNFFENSATEYTKAGAQGDWGSIKI